MSLKTNPLVLNEVVQIQFPETENERQNQTIQTFVEAMSHKGQSVDYYREKRKARCPAKDIALGKKAEAFSKRHFEENCGFPEVVLDFEVRKGRRKEWAPDLPYSRIDPSLPDVHVKSCDMTTYKFCRGDFSWTFQYENYGGGGGRDVLFTEGNRFDRDLVSLVYMDFPTSSTGGILSVLPWGVLRQYLEEPIAWKLRGLKKCIYFKTLVKNREQIEAQCRSYRY